MSHTEYAYLGTNRAAIAYFSKLLNEMMHCVLEVYENRQTLFEQLVNRKNEETYVLFYEKKENYKEDSRTLKYIKSFCRNISVVLIADELSERERKEYLSLGIHDAISANPDEKSFVWLTHYYNHVHERIIEKPSVKELISFDYQLPVGKRIFDIAFSSVALLLLSPLLLTTAFAIRLESKGPIIYRSRRVGTNFKIFHFFKFRSMYVDADSRLKEYLQYNQYQSAENTREDRIESVESFHGDLANVLVDDHSILSEEEYLANKNLKKLNAFVKLEKDPRVTKVGRILRKYSLDELPQFVNILKGDMSVVGNRPLPLYEAELLTNDNDIQRFVAPAGLTGLWQVEKRGDGGRLSAQERTQLDIQYANNYSVWMDLKIIFRTFTAFIQKEDV